MDHENVLAVPPDGGWGWIVASVSFYGLALIDVPSMCFQTVQPFLIELFSGTASKISFIFSIYALLLQLVGPVSGGVCNRFGFKVTAITGSLLMAIGFIPLYFVKNYIAFVIMSSIAGAGASLVILVSTVAPGFWFETKRALVLGLVSSATGVSLYSVYICDALTKHFGWRYCFIFWALLAIIMGVLSFLLKPPPMIEMLVKDIDGSTVTNLTRTPTAQDVMDAIGIKKIEMMSTSSLLTKKVSRLSEHAGIPPVPSYYRVPSRYASTHDEPKWCAKCCSCSRCRKLFGSRPLYRKDIFFQGNLEHASELKDVPSATYTLRMTKLPTVNDVQEEVKCGVKVPEAMTRAIRDMIDFSLFKSWAFLLLAIATFFCYMGIYIPFLQIKRVNQGKMQKRYLEFLPIVMGTGLIGFRISFGFILYYFPKISAIFVTVVAAVSGGLVFLIVPLSHTAPYQYILAFCGGGFITVIIPLRSIVIIEELGLDRLTSCMGILFFVQGIACFVGLPIAELLNEGTGLIYSGLVFSAICFILTGVSFAMIGLINYMRTGSISATTIVSVAA